jgi:hypothetical protein
MGTGYGYPFSLNTTTQGLLVQARSIGIINRPGSNSQGNTTTSANTAIESLFKLMLQLIPEIVAVHL